MDELLQVAINDDPSDEAEQDCETTYYALQDANYNVIGLTDANGELIERYEYSPYGLRTVFRSYGSNDPLVMAPVFESQSVTADGTTQPYGLCDIGHQGLYHDKEFQLIYNRARYLSPRLRRFISRDPLGYINGPNLYEYVASNPINLLDALGLDAWPVTSKPYSQLTKAEKKDLRKKMKASIVKNAKKRIGKPSQDCADTAIGIINPSLLSRQK